MKDIHSEKKPLAKCGFNGQSRKKKKKNPNTPNPIPYTLGIPTN